MTGRTSIEQNGLIISPVDHEVLNQFGVPAVGYGPRARNIHAIDEAVELASIVTGAKTLARFMTAFYAGEVIPA